MDGVKVGNGVEKSRAGIRGSGKPGIYQGPGPDGGPDRRRYPALGMAHRRAIPPDENQRAEDVAAYEESQQS